MKTQYVHMIGAVVCASALLGGYEWGIRPFQYDLAKEKSKLQETGKFISEHVHLDTILFQHNQEIEETEAKIAEICRSITKEFSISRTVGVVNGLARETGFEITSLQPEIKEVDGRIRSTSLVLVGLGDYPGLYLFVKGLCEKHSYWSIENLSLTAQDEEGLCRIQMTLQTANPGIYASGERGTT